MAPYDRKIKCRTRLGALDVPRSSAHKAEKFAGFAHCSVTCFCEVRLLDTHTTSSFSVSPDSKGVSFIISVICRGDFLRVIHWYLHLDWLNVSPDDSGQLITSLRSVCKALQSVKESMLLKILVSA